MMPKHLLKTILYLYLIRKVSSDRGSSWVFSSLTSSVVYSCDSSKYEQLGYTCSCSFPAVECQSRNLTDLTSLDIPDDTEVLDLSRNLLEYLTASSLAWQAAVHELFLSHNLIKNISDSAFSHLKSLQVLDLSHNQLDHLQSGLFRPLLHLSTLSLSHNHLTQLHHDLFPTINLLSSLSLSHNPLHNLTQAVPGPLSHMSSLVSLDLSNCSLRRLHLAFLQNTSQLSELRLSSNLLDYIPTTTLFDTRATLQLLDMSQNPVTVLPSHGFHGLYGLKTLIISNMPRLEKIEALAFHDLHSLATVECRNNHKLSYIHSKAFRDNLHQERHCTVSVLDLSGNNLTSLSKDLLTWSSLQSIHLEGNPWSCTCSLSWLAHLSSSQALSNQPTCASPGSVATQPVDVLLHCSPGTDWLLPTLLAVSMACLPVLSMLAYMAAQARWPHKLPALHLLGRKRDLNYHRLARGA
jgi:Leucine-rich repeat (LRR) protein